MTEISGLRSITPLGPESLRGITAAEIKGIQPEFVWVDPRSIFVEDYQRGIGENGIKMIRNIYAGFDWTKFKPPVCVRVPQWDDVLVCIDGQHTATAAASHPGLSKIPVMVVSAVEAASRARAFVGHNRDRLGLTQMAIFHAEVAAGDPVALKVAEACKNAGAEILSRSVNLKTKLPAGKTIAVGTIRAIAKAKGANFLTRVLKVMVAADRGPMKADEIGAVALVLEAFPLVDPSDRLAETVKSKSAEGWAASVAQQLAETGGSLPVALARIWAAQIGLKLKPGTVPTWRRGGGGGGARPIANTARLMARRPKPESILPAPKLPVAKKTAPVAAVKAAAPPPAAPKPAPKPEPPKAVAMDKGDRKENGAVVSWNGITLDLMTRELEHRGMKARIHRDEGVRLVAALARITPALLTEDRAATKAFGGPQRDYRQMLRSLEEDIRPILTATGLEIKFVPKDFICLRTL